MEMTITHCSQFSDFKKKVKKLVKKNNMAKNTNQKRQFPPQSDDIQGFVDDSMCRLTLVVTRHGKARKYKSNSDQPEPEFTFVLDQGAGCDWPAA